MPDYRPTKITVYLPHFDEVDITNHDRAEMVEPLLRAFAQAYYYRDYDADGPLLDYMVSDFLADVMHWCDKFPVLVGDGGTESCVDFTNHVEAARAHYVEEVDEELLQEEDHDASL